MSIAPHPRSASRNGLQHTESRVPVKAQTRVRAIKMACTLFLALAGAAEAAIVTFEDLTLPPESYWNGADGSGGFRSGGAFFENRYTAYDGAGFWDGFAYSNRTDTEISGIEGQYNAIPGSGQGDSQTYGIAFVGWEKPPTLTLSTPQQLQGLYVTNNNYTYYDLIHGSGISKPFGGQTGDDPDWLKLSITGKDIEDNDTATVDFYLADFRFADNSQDHIVDSWKFVDLTPLGEVAALQFTLDSSDTGDWGMNTPAYFCIDTVVPEPATILLLGLGALFAVRGRK